MEVQEISKAMMEPPHVADGRLFIVLAQSFAHPVGPMKVSQAAWRFLQVGLELVDGLTKLVVSLRLHFNEQVDESVPMSINKMRKYALLEFLSEFRIPDEIPRIEKSRIRLHLAFIEHSKIRRMPNLMPYAKRQIPQRVQDG